MRGVRIESVGVSPPRRRLLPWGSVRHAVEAGKVCLAASRYRPDEVRVLINAGVHRDEHVCEPAIACYVQHGLDINIEFQGRRTLAFDLMNGGVGMLNAAQVLSSLVRAGEAEVGLVVSSEANGDREPDPGFPYPASGAAVLLDVAPREGQGFGAFAFDTREEKAELFTSVVSLAEKRGRLMMRRAAELEAEWLEGARRAVDEVLAVEGLRRDDVARVIPAQVSAAFLKRLPAVLGVSGNVVADYTSELPDTHSTSTFLAFERSQATAPMGPGKVGVLLAVGSGLTVGAAVYRF